MSARRHPLEVTADRIADVLYNTRYTDLLSGEDLDLLSEARHILEQLAERAS